MKTNFRKIMGAIAICALVLVCAAEVKTNVQHSRSAVHTVTVRTTTSSILVAGDDGQESHGGKGGGKSHG